MERAAQKGHMAADRLAAGKTADRLVDNSLENGGSQVFFGGAFIDQGLYVRFGKNTAAGGDRVNGLIILAYSFRPAASVFRRVAIWSIKDPVPPAQIPFIRCFDIAVLKIDDLGIFPASSMATSVWGA